MNRFISILVLLLTSFSMLAANSEVEKRISKIKKDSDYIWSDVRASTEEEARKEAIAQLSDEITKYMKETKGNDIPDAVYLSKISSQSEELITHISQRRYRVFLFIKKSAIMPVGNDGVILAQADSQSGHYTAVETPAVVRDTTVIVIEKPLSPSLSRIASLRDKSEIQPLLVQLMKEGRLSGAAAFPLTSFYNFYAIVVNRFDKIEALLYHGQNGWVNVKSGTLTDLSAFDGCTAYWFVLSE